LFAPNIVILNQITHYLVNHPKNNGTRKLVVASGTCNSVSFEVTAINDPDFSTKMDVFSSDGCRFSKLAFQAIRMRIKMAKPMETIDQRGNGQAKGYGFFYDQMCEKYYGKKIYLRVPFSRKDEAKSIGAKWDGVAKKWYVFASSPDRPLIEKSFNLDE